MRPFILPSQTSCPPKMQSRTQSPSTQPSSPSPSAVTSSFFASTTLETHSGKVQHPRRLAGRSQAPVGRFVHRRAQVVHVSAMGRPMLRGGGVAFGPKPRDFATDLPRKVRMLGMRVALSSRLREGALGVTSSLDWPLGAKTGPFANRLSRLGWTHTLFIAGSNTGTSQSYVPLTPDELVRAQQHFDPYAGLPPRFARVTRNVPNVHLTRAEDTNVLSLLQWPRVILDLAAVDYFERLLGTDVPENRRIPIPPPPLVPLRLSRAIAGRKSKFSPTIREVDQREGIAEPATERQMFE